MSNGLSVRLHGFWEASRSARFIFSRYLLKNKVESFLIDRANLCLAEILDNAYKYGEISEEEPLWVSMSVTDSINIKIQHKTNLAAFESFSRHIESFKLLGMDSLCQRVAESEKLSGLGLALIYSASSSFVYDFDYTENIITLETCIKPKKEERILSQKGVYNER